MPIDEGKYFTIAIARCLLKGEDGVQPALLARATYDALPYGEEFTRLGVDGGV